MAEIEKEEKSDRREGKKLEEPSIEDLKYLLGIRSALCISPGTAYALGETESNRREDWGGTKQN